VFVFSVSSVTLACSARTVTTTQGRAYAIEREIRNDQKGRQSNSLIYFDAAYIRAPLKNRPLDPHSDDVEVRPKEQVFAEAGRRTRARTHRRTETSRTAGDAGRSYAAVAVQNGRMLATYSDSDSNAIKNNEKLVHLDFSFALEMRTMVSFRRKVKEAWKFLKDSDNKLIWIKGIPPITLGVFMDPKARSPSCT